MKRLIILTLLRLEYGMHRVDAYLAQMRGDNIFAADCMARAYDIERRMDWMGIQA